MLTKSQTKNGIPTSYVGASASANPRWEVAMHRKLHELRDRFDGVTARRRARMAYKSNPAARGAPAAARMIRSDLSFAPVRLSRDSRQICRADRREGI